MAVPGKKAPQKYSSTMSRGSGEDFDVYCQPCDRDDALVLASGYCVDCEEHLCDSCLNHHKKAKPSRHHKLLDKENMPSIQQSSTAPAPYGQTLTKPCSKHSQEFIKFYCHDHKALLCSVCATLQHTVTSCHVDYIPDVSGQVVDSKEYTDTLKEMDSLSDKCQKITADLKEMVTKSNGSLTDVLAEIKKFRKEINQKLDKLEKKAEDAAKALKQENDSRLTAAEIISDDVTNSIKVSADSIQLLNTSKHADRLFMELQSAKNLLKDNEKCISHLASPDVNEYHFQPNQALVSLFENEKSLGTIIDKTVKFSSSTVDFKAWKPSLQTQICAEASKDEVNCYITGITLLNPSKLILIDRGNKSVKLIDTNNKSVIYQLNFDIITSPYGVTSIASDQVAVTLPYSKLIQFISVSSHKLTRKYTFRTDECCYGISHYNSKLLVSCDAKLQILDMKGTVLTTFKSNSGTQKNVTANSRFIYLPDSQQGAVLMFSWQGDLVGRHSGMGSPEDFAMLDNGSFLVSDFCNDMRNIKHISEDCSYSTVVLKNMCSSPYAICWCEATSTLYVSYFSSDRKYCNFIQVFKMS